jgi:hypothetical protein
MRRTERKLFRINDEILALREAERLATEELGIHRHLNDDAARDAAVSDSPIDREDARDTASDVARFERHIAGLRSRIQKLERRREQLLGRLDR